MKFAYKQSLTIFSVALVLSGCEAINRVRENKYQLFKSEEIKTLITEKKTVGISCKKGDINIYLEDGWEIKDRKEQEVVCSWKSEQARKGCNIDKDKGCKITVPDKTGKQIIYYLERNK